MQFRAIRSNRCIVMHDDPLLGEGSARQPDVRMNAFGLSLCIQSSSSCGCSAGPLRVIGAKHAPDRAK